MKKILLVMVAVFLSLTVSSQVMAWTCGGYGGYVGDQYGGGYSNPTLDANYQKFLTDTTSLREQFAAKQGALTALISQPNPDQKYAGQLCFQMAKLNKQIRDKALSYGLPATGYYGYCNHSCGWGAGAGGGGWGCW